MRFLLGLFKIQWPVVFNEHLNTNATVKLLWIINYLESKRKQSSVPDLHADLIMHQEIFVLGFLVLRVFKNFLQLHVIHISTKVNVNMNYITGVNCLLRMSLHAGKIGEWHLIETIYNIYPYHKMLYLIQ